MVDMTVTVMILVMMFFGCGVWIVCLLPGMEVALSSIKEKDLGQWSVCMHCHKRIKWYDNVPIVSWLVLRGRCRNCHEKNWYSGFFVGN